MFTLVEQVIEVPKITLEDGIPQRAVLREPLPVEQLADVPVPETVILARGRCALGVDRYHTGGWVAHPVSSGASGRVSPPAQGGFQILGAVVRRTVVPHIQEQIVAVVILVVDVPVLMQLKFQQSEAERSGVCWWRCGVPVNMQLKIQQSSPIDHGRCLRIRSSTECWSFLFFHRDGYAQCKLCGRLEIPQCSFRRFSTCPFLCNDRCLVDVPGSCWTSSSSFQLVRVANCAENRGFSTVAVFWWMSWVVPGLPG